MKAITVRQPWAWAIVEAGKLIENRSRGTSYRGPLAIHAGRTWSERGADDPRVVVPWATANDLRLVDVEHVDSAGLAVGAIIGVADLVDVHPDAGCCRPWGESSYEEAGGRTISTVHHLVLENALPLRGPLDCRGALGLWTVPPSIVAGSRLLTRYELTTEGTT